MAPVEHIIRAIRCGDIPQTGWVFVGKGSIDKRIVPRGVPVVPISYDGRELADLHVEAPVVPRCEAERVFIETHACLGGGGIKAAIDARLREDIDVRTELRIEEEREPRIEERMPIGFDQRGRGLFEVVALQVHESAQSHAAASVKR